MTDKELTIWEHLDSVMRVLTSKEMGAWLYRRDKRVLVTELEKIKAEIKTNRDEWIKGQDAEWHTYDRCIYIIDNYIAELKGEINELERRQSNR